MGRVFKLAAAAVLFAAMCLEAVAAETPRTRGVRVTPVEADQSGGVDVAPPIAFAAFVFAAQLGPAPTLSWAPIAALAPLQRIPQMYEPELDFAAVTPAPAIRPPHTPAVAPANPIIVPPPPQIVTPSPSTSVEPPTPAHAACVRLPNVAPDLVLAGEPRAFNQEVNRMMRESRERILVDLAVPTLLSAPPSALQPWLKEISVTGGKIEEDAIVCVRTRGVLRFVRRSLLALANVIRGEDVFAPAKDYDVVLLYDLGEQQLRQVMFRRRQT
jgi:hypothetical protein